jgi:LPS-assembly lipoprotein
MSWCRATAALPILCALLLAACGFQLRGTQQLPFATIALTFPPNSTLGILLTRNIRAGTNTQVIAEAKKASAVLELISETQDRTVLTLDSQGRATEYTLKDRLRIRLLDDKGREVIEPTLLEVHRDIAFNDSQRLSKESEEALLYRDMQADLVQQIMRRLAAAKPYATTD